MFPNLIESTKEYWHNLDQLENAYQQGKIPLKEVDAKVAELMNELAQERRDAFTFFLHGCQIWLTRQRETIIGLAILVLITYFWLLNISIP